MKNLMYYKDFLNEGLLSWIINRSNALEVKKLAKLSHIANLLIQDINDSLKNNKHPIAKKIAIGSLQHLVLFRHTLKEMAKLTAKFHQTNIKDKEKENRKMVDWHNYDVELKKMRNNVLKSREKYIKTMAKIQKNTTGKDDIMIKKVLDLHTKY